jgi:AcrR family transcriptional regulator
MAAVIRAGRPKGDKRERTRRALIEAAGKVISEKGYDRTSLEEVAARAGMTRGAIYGNFDSREALFMAVVEDLWTPVTAALEPGAPFKRQMRILGEAVAREARARLPRAAAAASFQLYLYTHPAMRARFSQANTEIYRQMAAGLVELIPPAQMPMPPEQLVKVLDAMITGLMSTYFQTPELISEEDFIAAFEALA